MSFLSSHNFHYNIIGIPHRKWFPTNMHHCLCEIPTTDLFCNMTDNIMNYFHDIANCDVTSEWTNWSRECHALWPLPHNDAVGIWFHMTKSQFDKSCSRIFWPPVNPLQHSLGCKAVKFNCCIQNLIAVSENLMAVWKEFDCWLKNAIIGKLSQNK